MSSSVQQLPIWSGKRLLLALAGIFLLCSTAQAAQITLAWSKVSGSTVAGYKLYCGTQSAKYTTTVNAGNTTQYTISGLAYDTTYYFAAKTYDSAGNESDYSSEITGKIPTPNGAPSTPVLYLGSSAYPVGTKVNITAASTDPNGDALEYRFDWGDGTVSAWGSATQSHTWTSTGAYCLKGQAIDGAGVLSGWSACSSLTVDPALPPASDPSDQTPPSGGTGQTSDNTIPDNTGNNIDGGTGQTGTVNVWIEAEDGDIGLPMEIGGESRASADGYIWAPSGVGNDFTSQALTAGSVEYHVDVPEDGDYLIWGRVLSPTYGDDSYFISVDGGPYLRWDTQVDSDWVWDAVGSKSGDDPVIYHLQQGSHSISLRQREDGTKIDRLLITNDLTYIPEGLGQTDEPESGNSALTSSGQNSTSGGSSSAGCFLSALNMGGFSMAAGNTK